MQPLTILREYLTVILREEDPGPPPPDKGPEEDKPAEFEDPVGNLLTMVDDLAKETKDPSDLTKALKAGVLEGGMSEEDVMDLINRISVRPEEYWREVYQRFILFIQ